MPYLVAIERTASSYNIVRVSLATGEANVVRTYRNTGTRAYQSIVALPDGRFAFLASQVGSGRGAVALTRIVIAGWSSAGFAVQRRAQTAHRLTGPGAVSASDLGISLAGTPRGSSLWRPVGIRYSAFTHGADSDLQPLF